MTVTAAARQKSAHSYPRDVSKEPGSQMKKFPKTALSDSCPHDLPNERKKPQSGRWIVLQMFTAQKLWKQSGVQGEKPSIPTHEAGKNICVEEIWMKTTDCLWNRIERH